MIIRNTIILIAIISINGLYAQDCNCTVSQVADNSVESCEITIGTIVTVATTDELYDAINQVNSIGGNMTILIEDGTYQIASTSWYPYITASDVVFRSVSGNRDAVILTGNGMMDVSPNTEIGISLVGDNITIADLTIRDVGNHGISTQGENMFVHNVRIQNTFEQMIKGTSADTGADNAIVQCSLFEYTDSMGPQWYIGGLDIHDGDGWIVRDNIFRNIVSPGDAIAEHAIHFWDYSSDNIVERNWIINCDRGIGFGLGSSPNDGGIIRNNMIYNEGVGEFHDVGISLETSPNTKVYNNTVFIEYENAIEYRFPETVDVDIKNNLTNQLIKSRNDGVANLEANEIEAQSSWFVDLANGDLHLLSEDNDLVIDQGVDLNPDVVQDLDKTPRPQGSAYDIGAHEFEQAVSVEEQEINFVSITISPNPSSEMVTIESYGNLIRNVLIYSSLSELVYSVELFKDSKEHTIDVSSWKRGVYIVKAIGDNAIHNSGELIILN